MTTISEAMLKKSPSSISPTTAGRPPTDPTSTAITRRSYSKTACETPSPDSTPPCSTMALDGAYHQLTQPEGSILETRQRGRPPEADLGRQG